MPVGAPSSSATRSGPAPVHVSNPVPSRPMRPARRARPLGPGTRPWWSRRARSCRSTCGWLSPPMVPSTAASAPSGSVTRSGDSVCGGRRPGVQLGGVAGLQREPDAAVVQEDPGPRDDDVAAPVGRVGLDEGHADAVSVRGAQVDRAARVRSAPRATGERRGRWRVAAGEQPLGVGGAPRRRRRRAGRRDGRSPPTGPPPRAGGPTRPRPGRRGGGARRRSTRALSAR